MGALDPLGDMEGKALVVKGLATREGVAEASHEHRPNVIDGPLVMGLRQVLYQRPERTNQAKCHGGRRCFRRKLLIDGRSCGLRHCLGRLPHDAVTSFAGLALRNQIVGERAQASAPNQVLSDSGPGVPIRDRDLIPYLSVCDGEVCSRRGAEYLNLGPMGRLERCLRNGQLPRHSVRRSLRGASLGGGGIGQLSVGVDQSALLPTSFASGDLGFVASLSRIAELVPHNAELARHGVGLSVGGGELASGYPDAPSRNPGRDQRDDNGHNFNPLGWVRRALGWLATALTGGGFCWGIAAACLTGRWWRRVLNVVARGACAAAFYIGVGVGIGMA